MINKKYKYSDHKLIALTLQRISIIKKYIVINHYNYKGEM